MVAIITTTTTFIIMEVVVVAAAAAVTEPAEGQAVVAPLEALAVAVDPQTRNNQCTIIIITTTIIIIIVVAAVAVDNKVHISTTQFNIDPHHPRNCNTYAQHRQQQHRQIVTAGIEVGPHLCPWP